MKICSYLMLIFFLAVTPPPLPWSTSLALGFRFHPTYEELVMYYLRQRVYGKPFRFQVISEIDAYKSEPWELALDEDGNKMVNEYVREYKIGSGSYGKVVLYPSQVDGKHYAIEAFHTSHLLKLRVSPSETAMTDVLREVLIMKMLNHPNIVNLVEVIDDPNTDRFYMVLEYVEGKWVFAGAGPPGDLGEHVARRYLHDIVTGMAYLYSHVQLIVLTTYYSCKDERRISRKSRST